jgi:hypothetical protein
MAGVTAQLDLDSQFDHERVLIERRPQIGLTLIAPGRIGGYFSRHFRKYPLT